MIRATIVDAEPLSCESLATLLEQNCPEVRVLDICYTASTALDALCAHKPDILFLDIEMPHMNGFELLEKLPEINFELIFTTSYDQYALKAIRFSALDYLLKPVDRDELQKAIEKAKRRMQNPLPQQIDILLQKLNQPAIPVTKIAVPTMEGLHMILVESIICCAADGNYTNLFLKNNQKLTISRTLKEIEELLEDYPLCGCITPILPISTK